MVSIECFDKFKNDNGTYDIPAAELKNILNIKDEHSEKKEKKVKKTSPYFNFLKEHRDSIKEEFFSDFKSVEVWDEDAVKKYYKDKELGEPKSLSKPRVVALVSIKAGQMWGKLSQDEKDAFKTE